MGYVGLREGKLGFFARVRNKKFQNCNGHMSDLWSTTDPHQSPSHISSPKN